MNEAAEALAAVRRIFSRERVRLEPDQEERFSRYLLLLEHWNARINLTSIRHRDTAILRHFVEPARALPLMAGAGPVLLDVGSGAGVPGLPLTILDPERHTVLVEANARKATFLMEAAEALALPQVRVIAARLEDAVATGGLEPPVHIVTARAWTGWGPMLGAVSGLMAPGGRAILFVGEDTLRALRRELASGTQLASPTGSAWHAAAGAGWIVRQARPLPHLDRGYSVLLELPTD